MNLFKLKKGYEIFFSSELRDSGLEGRKFVFTLKKNKKKKGRMYFYNHFNFINSLCRFYNSNQYEDVNEYLYNGNSTKLCGTYASTIKFTLKFNEGDILIEPPNYLTGQNNKNNNYYQHDNFEKFKGNSQKNGSSKKRNRNSLAKTRIKNAEIENFIYWCFEIFKKEGVINSEEINAFKKIIQKNTLIVEKKQHKQQSYKIPDYDYNYFDDNFS